MLSKSCYISINRLEILDHIPKKRISMKKIIRELLIIPRLLHKKIKFSQPKKSNSKQKIQLIKKIKIHCPRQRHIFRETEPISSL